MRFCWPDGHLIQVFHQHCHVADDIMFSPRRGYSCMISPEAYPPMLERIFTDIVTRFHVPHAVCIHPSNWVSFSRPQGQELLRQARTFGLPIWSYDQWVDFWEARDSWNFGGVSWDGADLALEAEGMSAPPGLSILLPDFHGDARLTEVRCGHGPVTSICRVNRHRESLALVPIPAGATRISVSASYRTP
jgi:hypothetical protein